MTDHTTAGRARAFDFTFSAHADREPERLRFVIGDGYGFERLHGHDRMGTERWVHYSPDEQDFDAVVRALLIECAEQWRARAERAERERDHALFSRDDLREQLDACQRASDCAVERLTRERDDARVAVGEIAIERNSLRAEVERWRVRAEQAERERDEARADFERLRAVPRPVRIKSEALRLYADHSTRTGWRLAKRPSSEQPVEVMPEPDAERLPEGWAWDEVQDGAAIGPNFVDDDGDTMPRMVWVYDGQLQYQHDRDVEPLAVVRAVIARHDRLTRERGQ